MGKRNNWQEFKAILAQHRINNLYHFTDRENLQSIINNGGLYSWADCEEKGITIAKPGGGNPSRKLDKKHGLEHYVRLSFTKRHPMMFVAKDDGRINYPVILEINPEILYEEDTLFSDKNAASNDAHVGGTLDDFKKIHFKSVTASKHFDLEESEQPYFQAEILVKNFVPLSYISNIESFGIPIEHQIPDEETLTTEVTQENLDYGIKDEFGAIYSSDGKRLLKGTNQPGYIVKRGTKVIGNDAFLGFAILNSITLPEGLNYIGINAFNCCISLKSISLPKSLIHIGNGAFGSCIFQTITLPKSLSDIEGNPFSGCRELKEIISQSPYYVVQDKALYTQDMTMLINYFGNDESFSVPEGVTHINDGAFRSRRSLLYLELPQSLTHIGNDAFYECASLKSISLPEGLKHIGNRAFGGLFDGCKFQTITLPKSLSEIEGNPFSGCRELKEIISQSPYYVVQDKALYTQDMTMLINYFGNDESFSVPEGVTHINDGAFCYSGLKSISLPKDLIHLGKGAFRYCRSLESLSIPQKLTCIEAGVFCYCESLKYVSLPLGLTHIHYSAFMSCGSLQTIAFPPRLRYIGNEAFYGCASLQYIVLPDSLSYIGDEAFSSCSSLSYASLPQGITHIGDEIFRWHKEFFSVRIRSGTREEPVRVTYHGNLVLPLVGEKT